MKWRELAVDPMFNLECYLDLLEKRIEEKDKEIDRLKAYKDLYKDLLNQSEDNIKQLIKILNEYKSRRNKAIEYINDHTLFVNGGIIKSILNGSDENE